MKNKDILFSPPAPLRYKALLYDVAANKNTIIIACLIYDKRNRQRSNVHHGNLVVKLENETYAWSFSFPYIEENDVELTNFLDSSVIEILRKCYLYYEELSEVYWQGNPQSEAILSFINGMCL